jgi:predicted glutamine amidotransferase
MGYVSEKDFSLSEFAGPRFEDFAALSSKHCDGWGVVELEAGTESPSLVIEPSQASKSEKFRAIAHDSKSNGALLHLRWATAGLSVKEGNTHPFTHGDISFIHNGGVMPSNAMDSFIDGDLFEAMRGDTDSERYFATIITHVRKLGLVDGIVSAVRLIREKCTFSSLNAMILTPHQMIIINEHNVDRVPAGEPADYYDLYFRRDQDGVLVASTGWEQSGWTLIHNHRSLVIDRATFEIEELVL